MPSPQRLRNSGNTLIDLIPDNDFDTLNPLLERVNLKLKQIVQECEAEVRHVYFPTTAMFSLLVVPEEDDPVEAATIGRDGMLNVTAALDLDSSPHRVM